MKKRKVISILLAAGMTISLLAGCGSGTADSSTTAADTDTGTEAVTETADETTDEAEAADADDTVESADKIIVFQSKVEITDQMEALAEDYEEETGVEVEVWGTTGDDYFQQLKTKLANNQGPTVFSLGPGAEADQMASYLTDLSDLSFADQIADGMAYTIDDKVYGIPYTAEGFGLVYNKDLYDPSAVTDTDSLVSYLEEQKAAGISGLGLSSESYFMIGHILNTPFALQDDPEGFLEELSKGEVKLADTEEFREFAELYAAIRENCTNPLEQTYDKEIGDFATGKSATIHQGNWAASMFADYEIDFDMGLAALPLAGNDKLAVSVPTAWFVNSQATPEEQQAGKDFLNWLYTSDTGIDYLMNQFGFIPVVDGMTNDNLDGLSQSVSEYIADGKTISWPMNDWPAGIVDVYLVPVAEEFFTTDMSAEDFLTKLDDAFAQAYSE
ncbi:MAG TPA: ABC transporter substrate-binding protein [Lachnospiraceae bacterium]|nr:ABC transporter substrate-binding protein [Lachnospiraceae bacterium]